MRRHTVLGSSGYIGSRLAARLRAQGEDVFTPARGAAEIWSEDLGTVYYCSGMIANFLADPSATLHAHVNYLDGVLRRARFDRLVYLSSCRLYDSRPGERCREADPLRLDPSNPRHLFDLSKALGENLCLTQSGGKGSVARLACVYDDSDGATGFLPGLLRRLRTERGFEVDALSGNSRDYIALEQVLDALLALGSHARAGLVANVASGENVSNEVLVSCLNEAGYGLSLTRHGPGQTMPDCDVTVLRTELGIQPVLLRDWLAGWVARQGAGA